MRKKNNGVQRVESDASANIISKAEAERGERERAEAEAEAKAKAEAEIKEKVEKTKKAREEKAKAEAKFKERARPWAKDKERDKVEIVRIADESREITEFEARERNNSNIINRAAVEAAAMIRFSAKIQGSKRERA